CPSARSRSSCRRGRRTRRSNDDAREPMMRYMLLICVDESVEVTPQESSADAWLEDVQRSGARLDGSRLRPVADATTVRLQRGQVVLSDGPFAETKEQIAGYDVIECADLDEAIEITSRHPVAGFGAVEVRP